MEKQTLAQLLDGMRRSAEAQYGEDTLNEVVQSAFVVVQLPRTTVDGKPADCLLATMRGDDLPRAVARALVSMGANSDKRDGMAMPILFMTDLQQEVYRAITDVLFGFSRTEIRSTDDE